MSGTPLIVQKKKNPYNINYRVFLFYFAFCLFCTHNFRLFVGARYRDPFLNTIIVPSCDTFLDTLLTT